MGGRISSAFGGIFCRKSISNSVSKQCFFIWCIIAMQAKKDMFHPMSRKEMEEAADKYIDMLQIKTASRETPIKSLSGGNQQKVILGRWLLTNPEYLILDDPTRGIDIGTKTEIQKIVLDLADQGMAVTFISSEVEEMLRTCSRMAVLRDGEKVGELEENELSQSNIMKAIAGGKDMDTKKIGAFLKQCRKEKNLTQEQLAEVLGVSARTVSRWETGTNMPDLSMLVEIAEYYEIEMKELLDGETLIALVGGTVYAFIMVHNGIWDKGLSAREALWRDFLTSVICAGIFSVFYGICLRRMGASEKQIIYFALSFLGGITIVAFIVLRILSYLNQNRRRNAVKERTSSKTTTSCTKIYNAKDIVEAGKIIELFKEHGITAFSQEASANVAMHGMSGFGIYGVDVFVETDEAEKAIQILEDMDASIRKEKF